MKNLICSRLIISLLILFFLISTSVLIQAQSSADRRAEPAPINIEIAFITLQNVPGPVLLVINPDDPDPYFYHAKIYSITWTRNGAMIGTGPTLSGYGCGTIEVTVKHRRYKPNATSGINLDLCENVADIK